MIEDRAKLLIISGPSGAGKSTVIELVMAKLERAFFSVSMTTRAPRPGETHGKDYIFATEAQFVRFIDEDGFLEHAVYVDSRYGTPIRPVEQALAEGRDVLLDIDVQGALQAKQRKPGAVMIFLMPPSVAELEKRLLGRGKNTEEQIIKRIDRAREEMKLAREYDYIVINDLTERAVTELYSIIVAEKCRVSDRASYIENLI